MKSEKMNIKLKDLMLATGWDDIDTFDRKFDAEVTVSVDFEKSEAKKDNYDKFIDTVISDVDVVPNKHSNGGPDNILCDWSGFVEKHKNGLTNFMVEEWEKDYQYTDHNDFTYTWIKVLHDYISGDGNEREYKKLINLLNNEPKQCLTPGFVNFYDEICGVIAEEYKDRQNDEGEDKFPPLTKAEIFQYMKDEVIDRLFVDKSYADYLFDDDEIQRNLSLMSSEAVLKIVDAFEDYDLVKVFDNKDIGKGGSTTSKPEDLINVGDKEK